MKNIFLSFLISSVFLCPVLSLASREEPSPHKPQTGEEEPSQGPSYRTVLKQFEVLNLASMVKIQELALPTPSSPRPLDVTKIISSLNKAQSNAQSLGENPEDEAFLSFKYSETLMKLALARSAHSRLILSLGEPLESGTKARLKEITHLLDGLYQLLMSAQKQETEGSSTDHAPRAWSF